MSLTGSPWFLSDFEDRQNKFTLCTEKLAGATKKEKVVLVQEFFSSLDIVGSVVGLILAIVVAGSISSLIRPPGALVVMLSLGPSPSFL
jgi:hypothetical protein